VNEKTISALRRATAREGLETVELRETPEYLRLSVTRGSLLTQIKKIGQSNDLASIVAAERLLVQNDLDRYANSRDMKSSLSGTLEDFDRIEKHMAWVADPAQYRMVNETHDKEKNRIRGVPKDEARQAFASHLTRLGNLHKSRLTVEEKAILDARVTNIATGAKLYEQMQAKAIGITPNQQKTATPRKFSPQAIAIGEIFRQRGTPEHQIPAAINQAQDFIDIAERLGIELPDLVKIRTTPRPKDPAQDGDVPKPPPKPKR
jgi:hypothetical protein